MYNKNYKSMLHKLLISIALMGVLFSVEAAENPSKISRRFSISSGYVEDCNSNEGMMNLPLSSTQLYSFGFDLATRITQSWAGRLALVLGDWVLHMPYIGVEFNRSDSNWFLKEKWWPYLGTIHEFGHARAVRVAAPAKFMGYSVARGDDEQSALCYYWNSIKYAELLTDAGVSYSGEEKVKNKSLYLQICAGGLNNESRLSQELANLAYRHNGHIAYFGPYLRGRIAPITYTAKTKVKAVADDCGDIFGIVNKYYREHVDSGFEMDEIQYGGWLSLLCSSSTYMFLKGCWDFIQTGNPIVSSFSYKGVRLPDVSFYFTSEGLSLEVVSGYRWSDQLWFNVGIETVYYPTFKGVELTPSIRYILPTQQHGTFEFVVGSVINFNGNLSFNGSVEWTDPVNPFAMSLTLIHHNLNTYVGERNIPSVQDNSKHDLELSITASFLY